MATIQKRGKSWRGIIRCQGHKTLTATFPTKGMAQTWADRMEREIADRRATGNNHADTMTLAALIGWYIGHAGSFATWGRSKSADLKRLQGYAIASRVASGLQTPDYVRHVEERRASGAGAATAGNDLIWIRGVIRAARGALGLTASLDAIADATGHLRTTKAIAKSRQRKRRLSADEEARLLAYFRARRSAVPMADIVLFALATARRQEEITRIEWDDLDAARGVCRLRDVKHPTRKIGNHKEFRILPGAIDIAMRQPRTDSRIFPHNHRTISATFTRATRMLGIVDLTFHDLRHTAISRLFEAGYQIHEVAMFSLHESWSTLRRYTHLKPEEIHDRMQTKASGPDDCGDI